MKAKEYLDNRKIKDGEHLIANSQDVYYPKRLVLMIMGDYANETCKPLLEALSTIKGAFWTEGESCKERLEDLKEIATIALKQQNK